MQSAADVDGVVQVGGLVVQADARHELDGNTEVLLYHEFLVAVAGIGDTLDLGLCRAGSPYGARLGTGRVAQHHQHLVGAVGHEIVAQGQAASHDGVEVDGRVGASLAL